MQKISMKISLTLRGPLLTQSTNPGELGLDAVVARHNDKEKTPYLPGTLITGRLRQAMEELLSIEQDKSSHWFNPNIAAWFGLASESDNTPLRKQLFFSDFDLDNLNSLNNKAIRDRITIDHETEAVKKQQIALLENPFISGKEYTFTGYLHFFAPQEQSNHILKHIKTAFNWLTQLGSMKSIGFGRVSKVEFTELTPKSIPSPSSNPISIPKRIRFTFKPEYPFCLAKKPVPNGNRFESEAIIPGGAILGAIATSWNQMLGKSNSVIGPDLDAERKELSKNFSKLRLTHAFPSYDKEKRPVVAPLSLVKRSKDSPLYDVSLVSSPCLIEDEPISFALDWKEQNSLNNYPWPPIRFKDWGWAKLKTDMRVRTSIDPESGRSQKGQLFSYEHILPQEITWHGELDLSQIEDNDRAKVFEQLRSLLKHGLASFSKTKTPAEIKFYPEERAKPFINSSLEPKDNSIWVVVLQTDALLGNPEKLDETSGAEELETMYKETWREISDNQLELVRYFARQKLLGGSHKWIVFQGKKVPYRPWLLTEAGSVFVLRAVNDEKKARNKIEDWLHHGLPLTPSSLKYYRIEQENQWQYCPVIPQNGYGEIAVNLDTKCKTIVLDDQSQQVQ